MLYSFLEVIFLMFSTAISDFCTRKCQKLIVLKVKFTIGSKTLINRPNLDSRKNNFRNYSCTSKIYTKSNIVFDVFYPPCKFVDFSRFCDTYKALLQVDLSSKLRINLCHFDIFAKTTKLQNFKANKTR